MNEVRCIFCNRKLRGKKSIIDKYGKHCYKLYKQGYRGIQSKIEDFVKEGN